MTVSCACPCRARGLSQRQRRCLLCSSNACHWRCGGQEIKRIPCGHTEFSALCWLSRSARWVLCPHSNQRFVFVFVCRLAGIEAQQQRPPRIGPEALPARHCTAPSIFSVDLSYGNPPTAGRGKRSPFTFSEFTACAEKDGSHLVRLAIQRAIRLSRTISATPH